ncbi:MAG: helix-turn-helix transcriptional regulator [Dongiaceae bacterium]
MINAKQIRAARALLDWNQADLALASDLSVQTIKNIENARTNPHPSNMISLQAALEKAGVDFTSDGGVRPKTLLTVLEGENCVLKMLDDAYHTLRGTGGEFLVQFGDDGKSSQEVIAAEKRLRDEQIKMRFIVGRSVKTFRYSLEEYRVIPQRYFLNNPIVIYGDKLANLALDAQKIFILDNPISAMAARNSFDFIWDHSDSPDEGAKNGQS